MKHLSLLSAFMFLLLLAGCSPEPNRPSSTSGEDAAELWQSEIAETITAKGDSSKLHHGRLIQKSIKQKLQCSGVIKAPAEEVISVTVPRKGFVQKLHFRAGEKVQAGAPLARLSHPDYLELQQEYLSAREKLQYYRDEYQRQGELAVDQAASMKTVQKAKASFEDYQTQVDMLAQQLRMLNIDMEALDKGNLTDHIQITAPVDGYIHQTGVHHGSLVHEDHFICQIIQPETMELHLKIHERYAKKIHAGLEIRFRPVGDTAAYPAKIEKTGLSVDSSTHRFTAYARLGHLNTQFKHGRHIRAIVHLAKDSVYAVPEEAVVEIENHPHLLIKKAQGYRPIKIRTGTRKKGFIEIRNPQKIIDEQYLENAELFIENLKTDEKSENKPIV